MKSLAINLVVIIGAYILGKGTNWQVGLGAWTLTYGIMIFVSHSFETMASNLVKVNNNLASDQPKQMTTVETV